MVISLAVCASNCRCPLRLNLQFLESEGTICWKTKLDGYGMKYIIAEEDHGVKCDRDCLKKNVLKTEDS